MSDVPILVCACGKRLRAPGAVPGRIGRCPACGGELRVPEAPAVKPPREVARGTSKPHRRRVAKGKGKGKGKPETEIWDGFIRTPDALEARLRDSVLYPLRGATGTVLLVIFPPLFWFATMPIVTAADTLTRGGATTFGLGTLFLCLPALGGLSLLLGYTLLFLGRVLASSALGERHHPRWPDWELSAMVYGLGRWLWAGFMGLAIGGVPAMVYWISCGDLDLFDMMILSELVAVGAVYALMALAASILHEDLLAANPVTVCGAVFRVGWGYVAPCVLAGSAVMAAGTVLVSSFQVESPWLAALLYWVFWVVGLYEAMVVLRVLGLCYHRNARKLGWFRDRTGWGV